MPTYSVSRYFLVPQGSPVRYVACNRDGTILGFVNVPVRDYQHGEWVDSATGEYGEHLECPEWETSMRKIHELMSGEKVRTRRIRRGDINRELERERIRRGLTTHIPRSEYEEIASLRGVGLPKAPAKGSKTKSEKQIEEELSEIDARIRKEKT